MTQRLKVGVVGCGEIAQIAHLPYLSELPQFEVAAICDLSPAVLDGVGQRYGVSERFTDFADLVALPELDVVLVSNKDHYPPVVAALEAGKHVLVEKPIAFNVQQADAMVAAARANDRKLMVGYMKRFDPAYQYALDQYQQLKTVHHVRVHNFGSSYGINSEIYDLSRPTDVDAGVRDAAEKAESAALLDGLGSGLEHRLDVLSLLLYNCSHDANVLSAAFGLPEQITHSEIDEHGFVMATLTCRTRDRAKVPCVWSAGLIEGLSDWDERIDVYGDDRRIEVSFPFPYLKNAATNVTVSAMEGSAFTRKEVVASFDEAFKREWRHLYDCIVHDATLLTDAAAARDDIEFLTELVRRAS